MDRVLIVLPQWSASSVLQQDPMRICEKIDMELPSAPKFLTLRLLPKSTKSSVDRLLPSLA
jgi:hypothetical protein